MKNNTAPYLKQICMSFVVVFTMVNSCGCNNDNGGSEQPVQTTLSLNRERISLVPGGESSLEALIIPYDIPRENLVWTNSDPTVASFDHGKIVALKYGRTTITATLGDLVAECEVNVRYAIVGTYYFDGWAGTNEHANDPAYPWAGNAPTHLTKRFVEEFPQREPVWGWRDDTQEIMDRQIDLAVENGVDFWLYCWYWKTDRGPINVGQIMTHPLHTSMYLHLNSSKKKKMPFCLLVANHGGGEIIGAENWAAAVEHWSEFFADPMHVTVDGRPLVVIFSTGPESITDEEIEVMQAKARELGFEKGLAIAGCGTNNTRAFTHKTHYNLTSGYADGSEEKDFQILIDNAKPNWTGTEDQPYIPVLNSGWDKRPWEGPDGLNQDEGWYFVNDTPDKFKGFLDDAFTWMDQNPTRTTKERIVLVYAWNEIGEGGYLVPTLGDPEAAKLRKIGELLEEKIR